MITYNTSLSKVSGCTSTKLEGGEICCKDLHEVAQPASFTEIQAGNPHTHTHLFWSQVHISEFIPLPPFHCGRFVLHHQWNNKSIILTLRGSKLSLMEVWGGIISDMISTLVALFVGSNTIYVRILILKLMSQVMR